MKSARRVLVLLAALLVIILTLGACDAVDLPDTTAATTTAVTTTAATTTATTTEAPKTTVLHTHTLVVSPAKASTCTEIGWDAYVTCLCCSYTTCVKKAALGHNYENKMCTRCGDRLSSEGLEFISNGSGSCYVSGLGTCTDTDIVIPSVSPKGDTVIAIGYAAFEGCSSLTAITIPASVIRISLFAFENCTSLRTVTIAEGIRLISIGDSAFKNCTSLETITIPATVTSIGEDAFSHCGLLTIYCEAESKPSGWGDSWSSSKPVVWDCKNNDVAVDGYIYTVIDGIRYGLKDSVATVVKQASDITTANILASINYKDTAYPVTSIGKHAFEGCDSLTAITIPATVTSIGEYAFEACGSLTIYCEAESKPSGWGGSWRSSNPVVWDCKNNDVAVDGYIYTVIDGIRYGLKDSVATVVKQASDITTANILASINYKDTAYPVTSIGKYAFDGCGSLTAITIPATVTNISEMAFDRCISLIAITIPASVISIGRYAFCDCFALRTVTFAEGSQLTSIGETAFGGCDSLTAITIPATVTSIGEYAFALCGSLTICCEAESQPSGWNSNWNSYNCPVVWGYTAME